MPAHYPIADRVILTSTFVAGWVQPVVGICVLKIDSMPAG